METFGKGIESEVSHTHLSDPPFLRSTVVRYTSLVQEMSDPAGLRLRRRPPVNQTTWARVQRVKMDICTARAAMQTSSS